MPRQPHTIRRMFCCTTFGLRIRRPERPSFRLYIDATGGNTAGKEVAFDYAVAANAVVDLWFPKGLRLGSSDFLVGGAAAAATLTIQGEGEVGIGA
jgi:hypothetical protein